MNELKIEEVEKIIGYEFTDKELLKEAFTHNSYANLHNLSYNYERLEFLGDSVLGFIVSSYLFRKFNSEPEGVLTQCKASMVFTEALSDMAVSLGIHRYLLIPENDRGIRFKKKVQENLLEALIGAIYLDGGTGEAERFVMETLEKTGFLVKHPDLVEFDYKTKLQEVIQAEGWKPPVYNIIEKKGPVHNSVFRAEVRIQGKRFATGEGKSKKQAHQQCAKRTLQIIKDTPEWKNGIED